MNKTKHAILLILLSVLCNSVGAQTYEGKKKDIDQILKKIEFFSTYIVNGDHAGLIGLYCEEAKIFPSNKDILSGDSLKSYWLPSERSRVTYHKITAMEIKVVKNIAYDYGYYEGTSLLADETSVN